MSFIDKPYSPNPTFDTITMPDDGTIGQVAGVLLTYDDTDNTLEVSGGALGAGAQRLEVFAIADVGSGKTQIGLYDTTAYAQDIGGCLDFGGKYNAAGAYTTWARIQSGKENGLEQYGAYMALCTRKHTEGMIERVRIDPVGNVGIAVTAFGTNAVGVLALTNKTVPGSSPADVVQLYCADYAGGHACLHLRNEDGDIIKLEQQVKTDYNNWTDFGDVVDALVAMGIFDVA